MNMKKIMMASMLVSFAGASSAQINNPGFEDGFDGWRVTAPNDVISISNISNSGTRSGRIRSGGGRLSQVVDVDTNSTYRLTAQLRGAGRLNAQVGSERATNRVNNGNDYAPLSIEFETGSSNEVEVFMEFSGSEGRWDDLELVRIGGGSSGSSSNNAEDFGLNPNLDPWDNFDLSVWGLDSPALRDTSATSGSNFERGVRIDDFEFIALREGSNNSNFDDAEDLFFGRDSNVESSANYFFTGPDGGMVFKSPVDGGRTSSGARFPRSELREYARAGVRNRPENGESIAISGLNENNWVLGYQPNNLILDDNNRSENIQNVGGRNGRLAATLRVNKVTETGRPDDIGATIIGQIHAEVDEPLRLYYRKLPQNDLGSVYFLHEIRDGDDLDEVILVGSRDDDASNPEGGIALNELFSYEIIANGAEIEVVLRRGDFDGEVISRRTVDMEEENSGYDRRDEWMYFKAGVYTQNNAAVEEFRNQDLPGADTTGFGPDGTEADYDQATFYRLSVSHDENDCGACRNLD